MMEWKNINGLFPDLEFSPNANIESLLHFIPSNPEATVHVRGSFLEECIPSIQADIDLYIIFHSTTINVEYIELVKKSLTDFERIIDIHGFTLNRIQRTPVEFFLFQTMSYYLCGKEIGKQKIKIDSNLIRALWDAYNPEFAPDILYSNRLSRVCALKNLTRCFGLISLIESGVFSRNIAICLGYAKVQNIEIFNHLMSCWDNVDQNKPLYLGVIKKYLVNYKTYYKLNPAHNSTYKKLAVCALHESLSYI